MKDEVREFIYDPSLPEETRKQRIDFANLFSSTRFEITAYIDPRIPPQKNGLEQFGLVLKPHAPAKEAYGIDREILVWRSTFRSFQARDMKEPQKALRAERERLSQAFWVLISDYDPDQVSDLESGLDAGPTLLHTTIFQLQTSSFEAFLQVSLRDRDFFDLAGATVQPSEFFGRTEILRELRSAVLKCDAKVAVFGLRKMGKTSLLNRLYRTVSENSKTCLARVDLQFVVGADPSLSYVLWSVAQSIFKSSSRIQRLKNFHLMGSDWFELDLAPDKIPAAFANDLDRVLSNKIQVCLLLDEIERLSEIDDKTVWVRFWQILRGADQNYPQRLSIVAFGTDSRCLDSGFVQDGENPAFKYLNRRFLGPLDLDETKTMMATLSKFMGFEFSKSALDKVFQLSGGHPALIRRMSSALVSTVRGKEWGYSISEENVLHQVQRLRAESEAIVSQIIASLESGHKDEFLLLQMLGHREIHEFRKYAEEFDVEVQLLEQLGLIYNGDFPAVRIGVLESSMRKRTFQSVREDVRIDALVGSPVGPWVIEQRLASGGYASVYRGRSVEHGDVATKVFEPQDAEKFGREVDALRALRHPSIVKVIEEIYLENGSPCLVMELLRGRTLASYCEASARPGTKVGLSWLEGVLSALSYMHGGEFAASVPPDVPVSSERTSGAKFVHRDIKPENIMIGSGGPVLIDFNIVSRLGAAVKTQSATMGYTSSNFTDVWAPEVDIYALGVTFSEVFAGARYFEMSPEDMQEQILAKHGGLVADLLRDMMAQAGSVSAYNFLRRVQKIRSSI